MSRMKAHIDTDIEVMGRAFRHGSSITVVTKDGQSVHRKELQGRASRENPPRAGDIEKNFRTCAGKAMDEDSLQKLLLFIQDLENKESLDELFVIIGKLTHSWPIIGSQSMLPSNGLAKSD